MINEFKPTMEQLTKLTGMQINTTYDLYNLFLTFMAESSMGLSLPEWTEDYFCPDSVDHEKYALYRAALLEYKIMSYNTELKKLNGGV